MNEKSKIRRFNQILKEFMCDIQVAKSSNVKNLEE